MKSTGIVRKVDILGRIVIPKEIRNKLGIIENETSMELFIEGENIIIRKYEPGCRCCDHIGELKEILGIKLCDKCIKEVYENSRKIIDSLR